MLRTLLTDSGNARVVGMVQGKGVQVTVEVVQAMAIELGAPPPQVRVSYDGVTHLDWWYKPRKLSVWIGEEVFWICAEGRQVEGAPTNEVNVRKGLTWLVSGDPSHLPEGV